MTNGPSYIAAPFDIDNSKRSAGSIASLAKVDPWEREDVEKFKPERWLVSDKNGGWQFNYKAGPSQPFGAGPRSCFGMLLSSS